MKATGVYATYFSFKWFIPCLFVVLMVSLLQSKAAIATGIEVKIDRTDPYKMVEQVAEKTFARFYQDFDTIKAEPDHLKVIVSQELMPYVDVKYAAYKVMGQHLRSTTKEQREQFVEVFKNYLIVTYAQALTEYKDQQVTFLPGKDFTQQKMVDVNVHITEVGHPTVKIQFRVRRLKDDSWKAFDLVAEGVSLLKSKSSEIGNLIHQKGIDAVIIDIAARSKAHISPNSGSKGS